MTAINEPESAVAPAVVEPPAHQAVAEAALAAVETALGDTLLPDAREEALAGIAAVLPEPADRAAVLTDVERAIRSATATCGYRADDGCDFCNGVDAALVQVRRMADETATTETPCWCGHPKERHWHDAGGRMTFSDGCHDCRGWNGAHAYGQKLPWLPEGDDTAAGARQDGAQTTALNVLRCLASPEACRWEGVYCVTHSWKSDVGRCPHGQAQALLGGGR